MKPAGTQSAWLCKLSGLDGEAKTYLLFKAKQTTAEGLVGNMPLRDSAWVLAL